MKKEGRSAIAFGALLAVVICAGILPAEDIPAKAPSSVTIRVDSWLAVGPLASPLPGFGGDGDKPFGVAELLKFEPAEVNTLKPQAGGSFLWADGTISRLAGAYGRRQGSGARALGRGLRNGLPCGVHRRRTIRARPDLVGFGAAVPGLS